MRTVKTFWSYALLLGGLLLAWIPIGHAQVPTAAAERKPALAVCYMYKFIRHVDEIAEWAKTLKCEPGAPLPVLDFYGGTSTVLTSKSDDGVLARITGFIHLDKAGAYKFAFESNDGVRLTIDGKKIVEDPGVHDDQFSDLGTMDVSKPGWYPLAIDFFERKSTWTLRFLWRQPGVQGDLSPVPATALAH
ncbi:MAG: PA14 domain-containing protein [Burkholderiaceae bacterium]